MLIKIGLAVYMAMFSGIAILGLTNKGGMSRHSIQRQFKRFTAKRSRRPKNNR